MARKFHPRAKLITIILIVLLAVGAAAFYVIRQNETENASKEPEQSGTTGKTSGTAATDDELKVAQDLLAKADTDEAKVDAYGELANVYINREDGGAKAVEYAQKAAELDPSPDTYGQLGFTAEQNGDYKTAKDAYQKALSLSDPATSGDARGDYMYYKMKISEIEAKLE